MRSFVFQYREDQREVLYTHTYDDLSRLTADTVTSLGRTAENVDGFVRQIATAYDVQGRTASATSAGATDGTSVRNEIAHTYNDAQWGRLVKSEQAHAGAVVAGTSPAVGYNYIDGVDGGGGGVAKYVRLEKVVYPNGREVYNDYGTANGMDDRLGRVVEVESADQTPVVYAQYSYLGSGTIVKVAHPAITGGLNLTYDPSGNHSYSGFDRFGRVIDQRWAKTDGTVVDQIKHGYDLAGNRKWRENVPTTGKDEFYTYDELNRLKNFDRGDLNATKTGIAATPLVEMDYSLGSTGNWNSLLIKASGTTTLDQDRTHNLANEITGITGGSWIVPKHDAAGNMLLMPKPGDESTVAEGELGTYDAWNRLVAVHKDDGTTTGELDVSDSLVAEYQYDGQKHRIVKLIPIASTTTWTRTDYYYNTRWQVVEERKNTVTDKITVATTLHIQWTWDLRYIDAPVCRDRDTDANGSLDETLYYTNDANMNVTALVSITCVVQERYTYDPYGKVTVLNPNFTPDADGVSDFANELLYCGYRHDPETGLYHVRHRMYHPTLGRWPQRDPAEYASSMSLYDYCLNSPISFIDFSGAEPAPGSRPATQPASAPFKYRELKWVDFKGPAPPAVQDEYTAIIYTLMQYEYGIIGKPQCRKTKSRRCKGNIKAYRYNRTTEQWDIPVYFDSKKDTCWSCTVKMVKLTHFWVVFLPQKSWKRDPNEASTSLLKHEQGHFMIWQAVAARANASLKKHKNFVQIANHCVLQHAKAEAHNKMHRFIMETIRVTKSVGWGLNRKYEMKTNHGRNEAQQAKINAILSTFDKNDGKAAEKIATALGTRLH